MGNPTVIKGGKSHAAFHIWCPLWALGDLTRYMEAGTKKGRLESRSQIRACLDAEKNQANCSLLHSSNPSRQITFSFLEGHENLEESFKRKSVNNSNFIARAQHIVWKSRKNVWSSFINGDPLDGTQSNSNLKIATWRNLAKPSKWNF